ncbi:MAG TPA: hypothetical protein VL443_19540 [Cyclobacteriaceae bacterium]|nr:hypothetical protein [Cyclobacteriaceae bacterium]
MKLIINYLIIIGCFASVISCMPDPASDLKPILDPSKLKYSVTQDPNYDNKVFLESLSPQVAPLWNYVFGTSIKLKDTVIIPFKGDFYIKYRGFGQGGSSIDSTVVTISQFDPTFFADPVWQKLTNNSADGYTWKLVAVKAGDSKSTTYNDWGDAGWLSGVNMGDSVRFDLDKAFNYTRYTSGVPTKSSFILNLNEVLPSAYLNTPGKALTINGKMPADDAGEMTTSNKNRFRIFKLSNDTLILGQGGYYTSTAPTNTFTYWFWYIRTH